MSLIASMRTSMMQNVFDITPLEDEFWPLWEQIIAEENGWA